MNLLVSAFSFLLGAFFWLCIIAIIYSFINKLSNKKLVWAWPPISIVLSAIILGSVLTAVFTGNEYLIQDKNCGVSTTQFGQNNTITPVKVTCTNLAYGYPRKFISGKSYVTYTSQPTQAVSELNIDVFSEVSIGAKSLVFDIFVWSTVSFIILSGTYILRTSPTKTKRKKK